MVQSMMNLSNVPLSFWGYTLKTVAHILNMVITKKVDKTPYEIWDRKAPVLFYIRVWGCDVLVKRTTPNKLKSRAIKCKFVGYPKEIVRYSFYYSEEYQVFVERNGQFLESDYMLQEFSGSDKILDELVEEEVVRTDVVEQAPPKNQ
ncbi:hypothetical protein Tco_0531344 [Tanacetum coccineum]